MSKMRNKAINNQYTHAKTRAFERYGIALTRDVYDGLNKMIKNGNYILLGRASLTRKKLYVEYKDQEFVVGWDKGKKQVATFIPLDEGNRELVERKKKEREILKYKQEYNRQREDANFRRWHGTSETKPLDIYKEES